MCVTSRFPTTSTQVHPLFEKELKRWGPGSGWWATPTQLKIDVSASIRMCHQPTLPQRPTRISISGHRLRDSNLAAALRWAFAKCPSIDSLTVAEAIRILPDVLRLPIYKQLRTDPTRRRLVRRLRRARPFHSCAQRTGSVGSHGTGIRLHVNCHSHRQGPGLCIVAPSRCLAAPSGHAPFGE